VTSQKDVEDVDMPLWKKRALEKEGANDANAAPFGMTDWNMEASTSATDASKKLDTTAATSTADASTAEKKDEGHSHDHDHSHSHDHGHS
jgi:hypothetical protein